MELQAWEPGQAAQLHRAIVASFPALHRWMPWAAVVPSVADVARVLARGAASFAGDEEWQYLLVDAGGEVVGGAGLHRRAELEVGYWVRTDRTGLGLATAAARALTDAAFSCLPDATRIQIRMDAANGASAAIPPKLGYTLLGVERAAIVCPGQSGRVLVWSLGRRAWEQGVSEGVSAGPTR